MTPQEQARHDEDAKFLGTLERQQALQDPAANLIAGGMKGLMVPVDATLGAVNYLGHETLGRMAFDNEADRQRSIVAGDEARKAITSGIPEYLTGGNIDSLEGNTGKFLGGMTRGSLMAKSAAKDLHALQKEIGWKPAFNEQFNNLSRGYNYLKNKASNFLGSS